MNDFTQLILALATLLTAAAAFWKVFRSADYFKKQIAGLKADSHDAMIHRIACERLLGKFGLNADYIAEIEKEFEDK